MTIALGNLRFACAALFLGLVLGMAATCSAQTENRVLASYNRASQQVPTTSSAQAVRSDIQVQPASAQVAAPGIVKNEEHRLLAPPSRKIRKGSDILSPQMRSGVQRPKLALPNIESFTTAGAGLAIVVGLFLVCMWLLRRSGPKPTSQLPSEAVAVLGKVPLAARNFAHLLQVGNKLVLVAITPDGVAPITEVTDPVEVQRMLGLCLQNRQQSTSAEFQDVLKHLTKEPASGFLGNEAASSHATHR